MNTNNCEWLEIEVTQEDIDLGEKKSSHFCPIALAIRRKFPYLTEGKDVIVGGMFCVIRPGIDEVQFSMPDSAHALVVAFDYGYTVYPRSFKFLRTR